MHRLVRGLIVGSLIGAATGGALIARSRMMKQERTFGGRAKKTMFMVRKRASRFGDAFKDGAWAFARKLMD
ncbi:MAG TPA: hypothetical protein VHR47_09885 [Bacillota bacterium]|jgi:hypothetical protein|nr:hypothetical protein [Bacillota bacterium]